MSAGTEAEYVPIYWRQSNGSLRFWIGYHDASSRSASLSTASAESWVEGILVRDGAGQLAHRFPIWRWGCVWRWTDWLPL